MVQSPQVEKFSIDGNAGSLECLLELPGNTQIRGIAVICHPHPVHGGTMQNKVAHTLARAFVMQGFGALRFNFRGVGGSDGEYADGWGEIDDVEANTFFHCTIHIHCIISTSIQLWHNAHFTSKNSCIS